jgi:hypothetical protein
MSPMLFECPPQVDLHTEPSPAGAGFASVFE